MVTFAQLKNTDPAPYERAAEIWRSVATGMRDRSDDLAVNRTRTADAWEGLAAEAVLGHMNDLMDRMDGANAALMSVDQALSDHAAGIRHLKNLIDEAEGLAQQHGITIDAEGNATAAATDATETPAAPSSALDDVSSRIRDAVDGANELDARTVTRLVSLMPAVAEAMAPVPLWSVPPPGTDPAAVKRWWNALTPAQQRWLIEHDPSAIGRLDGVPADARDEANRIVMEESKRDLENRKRDLDARLRAMIASADPGFAADGPSSAKQEFDRLKHEYDDVTGKLNGINDIEQHMAEGGQGRGYLLGFDANGPGHAIVATGNPDTAANLVTYVPGTGANLAGIGHDITRADRMAAMANQDNPDAPAVGVVWLGYDAPPTIPAAMDISYANHAETALSTFQDGLRLTHDGTTPSHNTIIGHSYGSTVVGITSRDHGVYADDVIFVGSPGVGVDSVGGMGMPGDHVWSTHLGNDPIQLAGNVRHAAAASLTGGVAGVVGNLGTDDTMLFGTNPDSAAFGGQHFASQDGSLSMSAHSEYWDPRSTSLQNIGHIVAGQPDQVTRP